MEFLKIHNFSFAYPGQEQAALRGVSLTVERGEFLVLCGPSGCGKSTLLRQLKPAIAPHGERLGQILLDGQPLESLSQADSSRRIGAAECRQPACDRQGLARAGIRAGKPRL